MSGALWIKHGKWLAPADDVTAAMIEGYKQGDYIRTTAPRKPRNPKHHRLMMAVLTQVVEHTWPRFADVDRLMRWLKLRSGMFETVQIIDGVVELDLESISFDAMDQTSFKTLCEVWLKIICDELMPGTDPEELLREAA